MKILWPFLKEGCPAALGCILVYMVETINLVFVGQLNDIHKLDGVGMGNVILYMIWIAAFTGLNGAFETLVSQAKGAEKTELCGIYLNRGRFMIILCFMPVLFVFYKCDSVLLALKQDAKVVEEAYWYVIYMAPSQLIMGLNDIERRFLIQMGMSQ